MDFPQCSYKYPIACHILPDPKIRRPNLQRQVVGSPAFLPFALQTMQPQGRLSSVEEPWNMSSKV